MSKLSPSDWEDVKRRYLAGKEPLRSIAKSYGVTAAAILKRARRDEWVQVGTVAKKCVQELLKEPEVKFEFKRRQEERHIELREMAKDIALVLIDHQREWTEVEMIQARAIRVLFDADYLPEGEANIEEWRSEIKRAAYATELLKTHKIAAEGLAARQEGTRRAYGLDFRQQAGEKSDSAGIDERRRELLESISQIQAQILSEKAKVVEGTFT